MNRTTMRNAMVAAAMWIAAGAQAQTTNAWVPVSGTADWNTAGNWNPAAVPDGATSVAIFTNSYAANFTAALSSDVTLNRLYLNDADATDNQLTISGKQLTFGGTDPYISTPNGFGGHVWITSTTRVDTVNLAINGYTQFEGPLVGDGTVTITGSWKRLTLTGLNSNFTGRLVVDGDNVTLDNMTGTAEKQYWGFGDTNGSTDVYKSGQIRHRASNGTVSEPFNIYGVHAAGSFSVFTATNSQYNGVMTLYTNGTMGLALFWGDNNRKDYFFNGTIRDDGNARNMHFLQDSLSGGTGVVARTCQIVFGGQGTYGGFTHLSNNKDADDSGGFDSYLQLTNGNDRLPVGTTMFLGGRTNDQGSWIGKVGSSGILILAGANQELAGLYALGTGVNNRVIGGVPTNSTLTLNIAAGRTNLYGGYLGGAGVNENNLALTKKGNGYLHLTNANTATGPTTIEAGTLRIGGSHAGATTVKSGGTLAVDGTHTLGLITIENGGTLGGIGTVGDITSTGTVAPGNSVGTLTANGNVTLGVGATLQIEIDEFLGDDYDKLVLSGGTLSLAGSPDLAITLNYLPGMGDAFTIVSGMTGFVPGFDGTFSGKPDLGTFDVSGTTFQIDYSATDITLTVVPEPHTLGLLGLAALGGLLRRRIRR